jgi:hypothetical protein
MPPRVLPEWIGVGECAHEYTGTGRVCLAVRPIVVAHTRVTYPLSSRRSPRATRVAIGL